MSFNKRVETYSYRGVRRSKVRASDKDAYERMRRDAVEALRREEAHLEVAQPPAPVRRGPKLDGTGAGRSAGGHVPSALAGHSGLLLRRELAFPLQPTRVERPPCPRWDMERNGRSGALLTKLIRNLYVIIDFANRVDGSTRDNRRLVDLATEHDSLLRPLIILPECDNGQAWRAYEEHERLIVEAKAAGIRAMNVLFGSAASALGELRRAYLRVCEQRRRFEIDGEGGLRELQIQHNAFLMVVASCNLFKMYPIMINGVTFDPSGWYADVRSVTMGERECSATDALDALRDEYASRRRPVPSRTEFTTDTGSEHFKFSELNTGQYSWAIVTGRLLASLEATRSGIGSRRLTVESGYRNPALNDSLPDGVPTSRHQYGDAADITPSDLNGDGTIDAKDRDVLYEAAVAAGFSEVIRKRVTVHMAHE